MTYFQSSTFTLSIFIFFFSPLCSKSQTIKNFNPRTTKIGNMVWMTENLAIPSAGATCYKGHDKDGIHWTAEAMCRKYGRLYTIKEAMALADKIKGWHLPTDEEWKQLEKALGMNAAEVAKNGWRGPGIATKMKQGSSQSDIRILMDGGSVNNYGKQSAYPEYTYYWTSTQHSAGRYWCRGFLSTSNKVYRENKHNNYKNKFYVRLVKDNDSSPAPTASNKVSSSPSPNNLIKLQTTLKHYDQKVHRAFFKKGKLKTKYPQVHLVGVELLVNRLKCGLQDETNDQVKAEYYQFIIQVNKQILKALDDRKWAKRINKNLDGMTAKEGDSKMVAQYLKLNLPPHLKTPTNCLDK